MESFNQTLLSHLEAIRTPILGSMLLSIACANVAYMLIESIRMSVYYLQKLKHM